MNNSIFFVVVCLISIWILLKLYKRVDKQIVDFKRVVDELYNPMFSRLSEIEQKKYCNDTDVYRFDGNVSGPTLLLVAGTHGNEPAGSVCCKVIIDALMSGKIRLQKGKLIIIPTVNICGLMTYNRYNPYSGADINRKYPYTLEEETTGKINSVVMENVKKADWIIDMHEAHGYYKLNNTIFQTRYSMGSTITYGSTMESKEMTRLCLDKLNLEIKKPVKQFTTFPDSELPGSLRYWTNQLSKHYILVETTGQNEIQPLELRARQHMTVALTVMKELGLIL